MSPFLCAAAAAAGIAVSGCSAEPPRQTRSAGELYASLARPGAQVDAAAARDMISIYRANRSLPRLRLDPALQRIAAAQVRAMAASGGADRRVRSGLRGLLAREKLSYRTAVQNVSSGYHTLPEAFAGWRQSKPHNANMLNRNVRRMGIATAYVPGTKYRVHWALVLAD
ncbi:MAG: CAP domain-containing protein [Hyphomicrobiales bacterium]|nr:CAP domain-containing protein [Hyphomicrobiales bacterium]